jgi:hypothetical protein
MTSSLQSTNRGRSERVSCILAIAARGVAKTINIVCSSETNNLERRHTSHFAQNATSFPSSSLPGLTWLVRCLSCEVFCLRLVMRVGTGIRKLTCIVFFCDRI